eukprot:COSAG02_NODE_444_length_22204_cov_21.041167_2_plen_189_part_00
MHCTIVNTVQLTAREWVIPDWGSVFSVLHRPRRCVHTNSTVHTARRCAAPTPYPVIVHYSRGERMGRGGAQQGSPSPVPVLRALRGPGGGFNHKKLNATTTAPFKPVERSKSPVKDIGARNRRGRANVGVSNRRTTSMPVEVSPALAPIPVSIRTQHHDRTASPRAFGSDFGSRCRRYRSSIPPAKWH